MDVINMDKINELRLGLETAYIDGSVASDSFYCPQFVSNNYKSGKKVLSSIEDELLRCDKFQISVAFITMGGVTPLLQTLKELEEKGLLKESQGAKIVDLEPYGMPPCLILRSDGASLSRPRGRTPTARRSAPSSRC